VDSIKVFGHDWAVNFLRKALIHQRLRQAYLIVGMPSIGKTRFAHYFAMMLNCQHEDLSQRPCGECASCRLTLSGNHPDLVYSELDPNTGALKIEALREVMRRISLKPYASRYRLAIISDFDHAKGQAQDAILKTLEEPPAHARILLLASSTEGLLPTILSRCQVFYLRPVPSETLREILITEYAADPERAGLVARLSSGRIGWAINAIQDTTFLEQRDQALTLLEQILTQKRVERFEVAQDLSKDKASLIRLLELWQTYWRDILLHAEGSPVKPSNSDRLPNMERMRYQFGADEALKALKGTQTLMSQLSTNVNVRLALEVMFLDYPGLKS
jgi:DNA polymerase-3 subunit delta'